MSARVGLHDLSVATTSLVLELDDLAAATGIDPAKYRLGLGQQQMSVPAPDEDPVTLAAAAAEPVLTRHGMDGIRTLYLATESGVDQSKSAGVFVHRLLGLPSTCRVVELKQACYGATAGLRAAADSIALRPDERALVIATDVARYQLDSPAEATQGAGAAAMLVAADPAIAELEAPCGISTADVDDFWRPNDRSTPLVDGKRSIDAYLDGVAAAWDDFRLHGGAEIGQIDRFCHHQPFTRMAAKALAGLAEHTSTQLAEDLIVASTTYNRRIGNTYTASLFFALAGLLDHDDELAGKRIGMVSYGSGSVSEVFSLRVADGYRSAGRGAATLAGLNARTPVDVERYRALHDAGIFGSDANITVEQTSPGPFHFCGIEEGARRYRRD